MTQIFVQSPNKAELHLEFEVNTGFGSLIYNFFLI